MSLSKFNDTECNNNYNKSISNYNNTQQEKEISPGLESKLSEYTFNFTEINLKAIPETWIRYFNGLNAGFIDVELAKKEMPWLVGIPISYTF